MLDANFWQDKAKSQKIIKEKKLFEDLINSHLQSNKQLKDLDDLYELALEENNKDIQNEINQNIKIILAEAIGHSENTDLATEYLIHYLNITADNRLILQALNSLTYISPRSDLVLPYVSKLLDSSDPYIRNASEYLRLNLIEEYKPSSIIFKSNITKKE